MTALAGALAARSWCSPAVRQRCSSGACLAQYEHCSFAAVGRLYYNHHASYSKVPNKYALYLVESGTTLHKMARGGVRGAEEDAEEVGRINQSVT